jgi:hypothetical protein
MHRLAGRCHALPQRKVETQLVDLGGCVQAVEIEVRDRHAPRRVGLHERERRARDLLALIAAERADDGAGERRLAGPELAPERDEVSGAGGKGDVLGEPGKLALPDAGDGAGGSHFR